MKKITTLFLLLSLIPIVVFSQTFESIRKLNDLIHEKNIHSIGMNENKKNYTGSPYENEDFIKGQLVTKSNSIYQDIPMRLNIYNNSIEYKDSDGKIFALENPSEFDYILIGESTFKYLPFVFGKNIEKGWFKVVNEGKSTLLLKPRVNFQEATKPAAYQDAKPASFKRVPDEIYIQPGDKPAIEVKNKKSLSEIFPDEGNSIKSFVKENKIKISDVEDMRKLVTFINSI